MIIKVKILSLVFEAQDSEYKIIKTITNDNEEVVITGYFPLLSVNLTYSFEGEFINHPKFGKQFRATSYKNVVENSKEGIVSYLSSDIFKGIGEKTALRIYETLGDDAINKIINNKDVLKEIKGINKDKIDIIYDTIISNRNIEELYVELYNYGLTPNMVNKLYETYKDNTLNKIKSNPYHLIYELSGFGFIKCDNLAIKLGFSFHDKLRLEEGLIYTLSNVCNNYCFTFLTKNQLINSALNLLNKNNTESLIDTQELTNILNNINNPNIIKESDRYYIKYLYDSEVSLTSSILSILKNKSKTYDNNKILSYVSDYEKQNNITYTKGQKEAILRSINSNISIITGGPGTGKTTVIKGILNILAKLKKLSITDDAFFNKVLLCAPTGRAAKRLGESCSMSSSTIHKALGYNYESEFSYNEYNKLSYQIIIIDESSMIDINLACNLFKAISVNAKIIIVGDIDQLPSVGPGNFLEDLINSNKVAVSHLYQIMRQASDSDIIKLSGMVKERNLEFDIFKNKREVLFYNADSKQIVEKILIFTENFINRGGNLLYDYQILVPMYSGVCGIDAINAAISEKFNDSDKFIIYGDKKFKVNDKVLQLQNDPINDIMNGDIGIIKDIITSDDGDFLYIDFDSHMVKYSKRDLDNLTLAYAISIHKSQGMEYKNVILPIVPSFFVMLKRRLIYTAVSRAKNKLIIVGSYKSLSDGINKEEEKRQTTLELRLTNSLNLTRSVKYINDPEIPFDTLGEEGMEGITPYTFLDE